MQQLELFPELSRPIPRISTPEETREQSMKDDFDQMFIDWNAEKGVRDNLHASSALQSEDQWCYLEHILALDHLPVMQFIPVTTLRKFWHGWILHEKWQELFSREPTTEEEEMWLAAFVEGHKALQNDPHLSHFFEETHDEMVLRKKWQVLFKQRGKLALEVETSHFEKKWGFVFTPDAIIKWRKKQWVVEIKGYREEAYAHMVELKESGRSYMEDPDFKKAALQANLYMYMLDLKQAVILIENKNTQDYLISQRTFSQELVEPYIERLEKHRKWMLAYRKFNVLPKRRCESRNDPRANRCPMRDACFAEDRSLYLKEKRN